ncbi:MAG: glycoside hydrolase family 43 protein [Planctomycetaceae bacterium]|jgi:beta-xylosidase|nr:glycoside hydrolase family 43 protein [Planctomycetaceae bacterium]
MMFPFFRIFCFFILFPAWVLPCFGQELEPTPKRWLFSYFTQNGEDGLHLAWSADGRTWKPLKEGLPFFIPPEKISKLVRDPSIVRGADGMFHLVWTGSWTGKSIGYASSRDLIEWTDIRSIPVMEHEPTTRNTWAPELFYDQPSQTFYIIWSSTIPKKFTETAASSETDYNHRMYYTTTKDFKTFSETKLYWNPNHNVIDGFLAKDGERYLLFYKDETLKPEAKKNILLAIGSSVLGPFEVQGVISHTNWVEGPTVLNINKEWFVYYDCYTKQHFGAVKSKDLKNWKNITDKLCFPIHARHGTAFEVDTETLQKLLDVRP